MPSLPRRPRHVIGPVRLPEPGSHLSSALFIAVPAMLGIVALFAWLTDRSTSPFTWYLTRASGLTLYLLFWAVTVLGLVQTSHPVIRRVPKSTALTVHIYLTSLAYAFMSIHILSLVMDQHVTFSASEVIVPFQAPTAEPWTGFGVIAFLLFVVIVATASLRRYIPYQIWRAFHILAFPMYVLSFAHSIGTGTDSSVFGVQVLYWLTASIVLVLLVVRAGIVIRGAPTGRSARHRTPFDRFGRPPAAATDLESPVR